MQTIKNLNKIYFFKAYLSNQHLKSIFFLLNLNPRIVSKIKLKRNILTYLFNKCYFTIKISYRLTSIFFKFQVLQRHKLCQYFQVACFNYMNYLLFIQGFSTPKNLDYYNFIKKIFKSNYICVCRFILTMNKAKNNLKACTV